MAGPSHTGAEAFEAPRTLAVITLNLAGRITGWNAAAAGMFGIGSEDALGRSGGLIFGGDGGTERLARQLSLARQFGEMEDWVRLGGADGEFSAQLTLAPVLREGEAAAYVLFLKDVSRLQEQMDSLRESRRFLETLIDTSNVLLLFLGPEEETLVWNEKAREITGYNLEEVFSLEELAREIFPREGYRSFFLDQYRRRTRERKPFENQLAQVHSRGGSVLTVSWNSSFIEDEDGALLGHLMVGIDITRERVYLNMLESRVRQDEAINLVYRLSAASTERESMLETLCGAIAGGMHTPGDASVCIKLDDAERAFRGEAPGKEAAVSVVLDPLGVKRGVIEMWYPEDMEPLSGEEKDFIEVVARTLSAEIGRVELKQSLEKQRELLRAANKELESFAFAVSHDLQEPLRKVMAYSKFLEEDCIEALPEEGREFVFSLRSSAKRMSTMISDILELSRVGRAGSSFVPVEVGQVLAGALEDLAVSISETNAVVTSGPLPQLVADGAQLRRLLMNLVSNALKFRGSRQPLIEISVEEIDQGWRFIVADNGIGFSPGEAGRIFDGFHRLDPQGERAGTGLGLALCRRIVERHGGRIWAESEPGEGSRFYFTIPLLERADDGDEEQIKSPEEADRSPEEGYGGLQGTGI